MRLLKKIKVSLLLVCLMFCVTVKANSIANNERNEIEILKSSIELENLISEIDFYNAICLEDYDGPGWEKFKEAWKEFWEGFFEGLEGGVGGLANGGGNDGGFSDDQLLYIENFAQNTVGTEDGALELLYSVEKLIVYPDSSVITEDEMLEVFMGDSNMVEVLKNGNDSFFPIEKDNDFIESTRVNWRRIGRILGRIAGLLILSQIP